RVVLPARCQGKRTVWPSAPGSVPMGRYERGGWMLASARGAPPATRRLTVGHVQRLGGRGPDARRSSDGTSGGHGARRGRGAARGAGGAGVARHGRVSRSACRRSGLYPVLPVLAPRLVIVTGSAATGGGPAPAWHCSLVGRFPAVLRRPDPPARSGRSRARFTATAGPGRH